MNCKLQTGRKGWSTNRSAMVFVVINGANLWIRWDTSNHVNNVNILSSQSAMLIVLLTTKPVSLTRKEAVFTTYLTRNNIFCLMRINLISWITRRTWDVVSCTKTETESAEKRKLVSDLWERRKRAKEGRTGPEITCRSGFLKVNHKWLNLTPMRTKQNKKKRKTPLWSKQITVFWSQLDWR